LLKFKIRAGRTLFRSVHKEFGGKLRTFISGGAPLDKDIELDLSALGFRILQGYGLTETGPVISVNTLTESRFGSVGKPLPGVEVMILKEKSADIEGEILTRGPHVMKGYFKDPEKTAEAIRGGWLHTGDLGHLDADGFLYVTGRKKNMIVLGSGKKVFPEEVEEVIGRSPYIKEICVFARTAGRGVRKGHEEVYALVVPDMERFGQDDVAAKEDIYKKISSEISELSKSLSAHKRIMSFGLYYDELPKTVTKKIRRDAVARIADSLVRY
jgi:long-chain acyl-CoA synthetase